MLQGLAGVIHLVGLPRRPHPLDDLLAKLLGLLAD
jgi:hypothetical protein